jgi:hypothetical protein
MFGKLKKNCEANLRQMGVRGATAPNKKAC